MDQEQELRRNLADLHREYCECAEPIIQELVKIENRKIPAPFIGPDGKFYLGRYYFKAHRKL